MSGRFGPGNNAGVQARGVPKNRLRVKARDAWHGVWTEDKVKAVAQKVLDRALGKDGDLEACKIGLAYTLGKPGDENRERLDELEELLERVVNDAVAKHGQAGMG